MSVWCLSVSLSVLFYHVIVTFTFPSDEDCQDSDENCSAWADRGECEANPAWMRPNCARSCRTCGGRFILSLSANSKNDITQAQRAISISLLYHYISLLDYPYFPLFTFRCPPLSSFRSACM